MKGGLFIKPVIGVLGNLLINEGGLFPGMVRTYVNHDYIHAVEKAGGVPLLLPVVQEVENVRKQVEQVDGILLTGGYDINPLLYGEDSYKDLGFIFPEVDEYQKNVTLLANRLGKPMLGICRGLQILNVVFNGTLYQDLMQVPTVTKHFQKSQKHVPGHKVKLESGTVLNRIFAKDELLTNSFHHQAIKDLAPGFIVSARAEDGVIEGIERPNSPFTVGVQWHPEMMVGNYPEMLTLFITFIENCR